MQATLEISVDSDREIRQHLGRWYDQHHRRLPWRETRDPYPIWVSEIMLQQTRVAAVLPYYERFLRRFPDVDALAAAPEQELLAAWSGLGYYSRARNLQKAARQIVEAGGFPRELDGIRALAGVGDYTAAAVGSIAFGLPHAAVDGNVLRVLSRLDNDPGDIGSPVTRRRIAGRAQQLLDKHSPGRFNQALMELGATICLPKRPKCLPCPIADHCSAYRQGTQHELPVKLRRDRMHREERVVLLIERGGRLLLRQRPASSTRLAGFWELPEAGDLPGIEPGKALGGFRHSITNHDYRVQVHPARVRRKPAGWSWIAPAELEQLPLTTMARKALALAGRQTLAGIVVRKGECGAHPPRWRT